MDDDKITEMAGVESVEGTSGAAGGQTSDADMEAIKTRVKEMEEETEKLKRMQEEVDRQFNVSPSSRTNQPPSLTLEEKQEIDTRSIYVGNVDYSTTADDLEKHFHGCGSVNRVTILTDKFTGHPKGFAYVEFADKDSVQIAVALDESSFRGRIIRVCPKRTNRPGISTTNRPPPTRGGFRGRGRGGGFGPMRGGRGRFPGGRGRWLYTPY